MLMRRVRQRAGRDDLLCIGTSATLVTGESQAATCAGIAGVGSRFFGVTVKPEHVVDETLRRVTRVEAPATAESLHAAVLAPPPERRTDTRQFAQGSRDNAWLRRTCDGCAFRPSIAGSGSSSDVGRRLTNRCRPMFRLVPAENARGEPPRADSVPLWHGGIRLVRVRLQSHLCTVRSDPHAGAQASSVQQNISPQSPADLSQRDRRHRSDGRITGSRAMLAVDRRWTIRLGNPVQRCGQTRVVHVSQGDPEVIDRAQGPTG